MSQPNENEQENQRAQTSEPRRNNPDTLDVDAAQSEEEGEYEDANLTLTSQTLTSEYTPSSPEADDSVVEDNPLPNRDRRRTRDCAREAKKKITEQCNNKLV